MASPDKIEGTATAGTIVSITDGEQLDRWISTLQQLSNEELLLLNAEEDTMIPFRGPYKTALRSVLKSRQFSINDKLYDLKLKIDSDMTNKTENEEFNDEGELKEDNDELDSMSTILNDMRDQLGVIVNQNAEALNILKKTKSKIEYVEKLKDLQSELENYIQVVNSRLNIIEENTK